MPTVRLHKTVGVRVGGILVGGGAPVIVQSMTMTDTADAVATARQCLELAEAGSEMVRVTVNVPEAAAAVPEIKEALRRVALSEAIAVAQEALTQESAEDVERALAAAFAPRLFDLLADAFPEAQE